MKKMGPMAKAVRDRMTVRMKKERMGSGMRRGVSAAHITTKGTKGKRIRQMKDVEMGA